MVQKLAQCLCVLLPAKVDEQPLRRRVRLQQLEEERGRQPRLEVQQQQVHELRIAMRHRARQREPLLERKESTGRPKRNTARSSARAAPPPSEAAAARVASRPPPSRAACGEIGGRYGGDLGRSARSLRGDGGRYEGDTARSGEIFPSPSAGEHVRSTRHPRGREDRPPSGQGGQRAACRVLGAPREC